MDTRSGGSLGTDSDGDYQGKKGREVLEQRPCLGMSGQDLAREQRLALVRYTERSLILSMQMQLQGGGKKWWEFEHILLFVFLASQ